MTRSANWLGMALLVGAPALAAAQESPRPLAVAPVVAQASQTAPDAPQGRQHAPVSSVTAGMSEDIEIMRRILSRDLHAHQTAACSSCHAPFSTHGNTSTWQRTTLGFSGGSNSQSGPSMAWTGSNSQSGPSMASADNLLTLDLDGTYLKDYGVVFHVTMPGMLPILAENPKPSAKKFSDWVRFRSELRGEKVDKAEQPSDKVVRDLDDVLLKCLLDNGHNFSRLSDKENLTIIALFRPAGDPHVRAKNQMKGFWSPSQFGKAADPAGTSPYKPNSSPDLELLGDLQVKQGRVQEAIQAYRNAIEMQPERKSLYQKLAQAYLKLDEKASNAATLAKAIEYLKLAQQDANTTSAMPGPAGTPPKVLTKLIVTAPKRLLDAGGKGLSFEEFRKAAQVERVTIPFPQKQEGKRSATNSACGSIVARDEKSGISVTDKLHTRARLF